MNKTEIEYADFTWNPVTGCRPVSEGCKNCYADRISRRFWGKRLFSEIQFHPERLAEVEKFPAGALVFLGSMTDMMLTDLVLFQRICCDIENRTDVHFVTLTKRPEMIKTLITRPIKNLMIGVSVENAAHLVRIDILRRNYAGPKCVSFEPLLGPIQTANLEGIDWVIVGQETGPGARPCDDQWFRHIPTDCLRYGKLAFFEKKLPNMRIPIREWPVNFRALKADK